MSAIARRTTRGIPASPGVAIGPHVVYERAMPASAPRGDDAGEIVRLRAAAEAVARELVALARELHRTGLASEARIFEAHAEIARDPAMLEDAVARVTEQHMSASEAVVGASAAVADVLRTLSDAALASRAADVVDVGDRIARRAAGLPENNIALVEPAIVIADDLPPSLTATLPRDRLMAIVLAGSSPTAHAAILARAYGIPAVVGAKDVHGLVAAAGTGAPVAVDGETGEIVIDPDPATMNEFTARRAAHGERRARAAADIGLPAAMRDGTVVELLANIGSPSEAAAARALGASGVGLFRTEFLFLERSAPPSEHEQAVAYGEVAEAFARRKVTVRLLDVGGDKPISYLPMPREENPFLGVRALRLAASHRGLFVTQLRACYRAATRGSVRVMAPMIADAEDARLFLDLAQEARADVPTSERGEVDLGVMLEIPSAILAADSYFATLRFGSLGTNDLLQYTLAADRGNAAVERYRDPLHPAHLTLIRLAVEAADRHGLELSVCGEMASDPVAALALVGLGLRSLSMAPAAIDAVKIAIRASTLARLEQESRAALRDSSASAVRERLSRLRP